jgi:hypothetical protein
VLRRANGAIGMSHWEHGCIVVHVSIGTGATVKIDYLASKHPTPVEMDHAQIVIDTGEYRVSFPVNILSCKSLCFN